MEHLDVTAAVAVLGRRPNAQEVQTLRLDFTSTQLSMPGADLAGVYVMNADLDGAYLFGADLTAAHLDGADLDGADLAGADLTGAIGLSTGSIRCAEVTAETELPIGVGRPMPHAPTSNPACHA